MYAKIKKERAACGAHRHAQNSQAEKIFARTPQKNTPSQNAARLLGCGGFTLAELIVVIVIMGILTAAILPVVTGYVATAREQVSLSNAHMVEQAARLYLTDQELTGGADSATISASELVRLGYLSPLPEGEDYTVAIARDGSHYTVTVTPQTAQQSPGD